MRKLHRLLCLVWVLCLALSSAPVQATTDLENFRGLAISYDAGVTVTLYSGFAESTVIEPSLVENNTNYYPNVSGKYRVVVSRSGYITVKENIYVSATEATTRMEKHYSLIKRDGAWDPSYVRKNTDEALAAMPSDPSLWPEYATAFTTPVFEEGRTMHKFTTQTEMETFLADLVNSADNSDEQMHIYSLGTAAGIPAFDIPLVIFTKTDLSGAETIEEAAALLEANGKLTVHYQAQIHGNEPAAGEAALGMIAMLNGDYGDKLLDRMNIYVIPRLNPYSAYKNTRDNPIADVNPNRGYLNLDTYEVSRTIYAMNLFNPEVVVDGHEHNVTLSSSTIPFMDLEITAGRAVYATEEIVTHADNLATAIFNNLDDNDLTYGFYDNFVTSSTAYNGSGYAVQRGSLSILMESYGLHSGTYTMARRVASHLSGMDGVLQYLYENSDSVNKDVNDQWDILIQDGKIYGDGDQITLQTEGQISSGHSFTGKKLNLATGAVTTVNYDSNRIMSIVRSRENPTAYLVPADHENIDYILRHVEGHGLSYYKLPENASVLVQHVGGDTTEAVITDEQRTVFAKGAYVFPMDQQNARILTFLMEPDVAINAEFNCTFAQAGIFALTNGEYPVYRYVHDLNTDSTIDYVLVPGAPQNLIATAPTDGANGSISGLDSDVLYEYRMEGESTYTALPAGTTQITGLAEGKYFIRIQATGNTQFSADTEISLYNTVIVYLDQTNGSDDNNGSTEGTAVATLNKAYALLSDRVVDNNTGTIVFVSEYTFTKKVNELPSHSFPVMLTSATGTEGFNYTYTASGTTNGEINLNGPTTFRKITINNNGSDTYVYLTAGGHKLVIEEDVITDKGAKKFNLVGGRKDDASTNSDMTVAAGLFNNIYLATYKGSHTGPVQFTMTGGAVNNCITPSYSGSVTSDIHIYAENANLGGVYLGNTSKGNVTGNVTVTLGKGVTCQSFYAGSRDAGDVNGTVTVIADGIDLTSYTINGKAKNTTGTVDGLKLVLKQGELADIAESFVTRDGVDIVLGCDQIEPAKLKYNCNMDLNGCDANITVTAGKTLTVWDSATDDYIVLDDQGYGTLSAVGTVVGKEGYAVRAELEGTSYHRWDFALNKVTLRTTNAGIYYTGLFGLNELYQQEVESYGVVLSLNAGPALGKEDCLYTSLTEWPAGGKGYGSVLTNIMDIGNGNDLNAANAERTVYGVAYIQYKDGTVLYSNYVRITLKDLVEHIDTVWDSLTQTQKKGLLDMYETYAAVMANWNIPKMKEELA